MDEDEITDPPTVINTDAPETVIEGDLVVVSPAEPASEPVAEVAAVIEAAQDHDDAVTLGVLMGGQVAINERLDTLADMLVAHIEEHAAPTVIEPIAEPIAEPVAEPVAELDENGEPLPIERSDAIEPKESKVHPLFRSRADWKHN